MHSIKQRFERLPARKPVDEYNFKHFRTGILLEDMRRTITGDGICPGEMAPDFELPQVGGDLLRLSDLRGRPVLMHFGSYS